MIMRNNFRCAIKQFQKSCQIRTFTQDIKPKPPSTTDDRMNIDKKSIQYVSDIHADVNGFFPKITPFSKTLAICGDVGVPTNPVCRDFLRYCSDNFEKVFFVPGNHDFDCGSVFEPNKVERYEDIYKVLCQKFNNVHYLNKGSIIHQDTLVIGLTLWSHLQLNHPNIKINPENIEKLQRSIIEHLEHVKWLECTLDNNQDKKAIILSHFVPTFKLIEEKYKSHNTSFFATNLERLIKPNIHMWLCGHTHSTLQLTHNGVYLGVNAHGYVGTDINRNYTPKVVYY